MNSHSAGLDRRRAWLALGLALCGAHTFAQDATMASKPIRLVVGYAPASGADVVARAVAMQLQVALKTSVVVDNKPGAGGAIGAGDVVRARPDGSTLLLVAMPQISLAAATRIKLPYDPLQDLVPVSQVVSTDLVLVVNPQKAPTGSARDFVVWAGKQPVMFFGTPGQGTVGHLSSFVFADIAQAKVEAVHYKATGDSLTALLNGDIQALFVPHAVAAPHVKAGTLRALLTTGPVRAAAFADVPTANEAGYPQLQFDSWYGVMAPAGTPAAILDRLSAELVEAARSPELRAQCENAGLRVAGTGRAEFANLIRDDTERWRKVVVATGFRPQE